jgi:hypothetical protein
VPSTNASPEDEQTCTPQELGFTLPSAAHHSFGTKGPREFDHLTRLTSLTRIPSLIVELTPEVGCGVVGNVDSGKSTPLGVLPRGTLDHGRGRARVEPFWHKHEIETGRTSHVGMEICSLSTIVSVLLAKHRSWASVQLANLFCQVWPLVQTRRSSKEKHLGGRTLRLGAQKLSGSLVRSSHITFYFI